MKVVVQVPCYNEEQTLPIVIQSIPKKIPGVDRVETMIVDDGSTDNTVEVAKQLGVDHIIRHNINKGLAKSFEDGMNAALRLGADIIVNTDGDNQYPQAEIPKLIQPILEKKADVVISNRQTDKIKHFSPVKKMFQRFGSAVVRFISGSKVPDAVSGFRAYSRNAAMQMNIVTDFSYVIETIMQSEYKRLSVATVDIDTNPPTRKSRLFKNIMDHMRQSGTTIIRLYTMFKPLVVFLSIGLFFFTTGLLLGLRFFYYYVNGAGAGHIQSLIFAAILITVGFQISMTGLVADLIAVNRKLIEKQLLSIRRLELRSLFSNRPTQKVS